MAITFMTNDQWAIKKGYTQFLTDSGNGYVDKNNYPPATTLDSFRDDAHAIILQNTRGTPGSAHTKYLTNLEYRMVELMMDEEQGRATEDGRPMYIPRDYLFTRDRSTLGGIGGTGFTRGVGH